VTEALTQGARVGPYTVGARIGAGASAVVFDATDARGQPVALKVLREDNASDAEAIARMQREAEVLRSVRHRAIVAVLDAGTLEDGRPWIALERAQGETLRAQIERGTQPREPAALWALLRPVCEGLADVHRRGVIHRDVKPENIVVSSTRAQLVDFGLARAADPSQTTLTGPGVALGTPPYMAPELWWNADVTASVDQYAMGCVLYESLTGRAPLSAESLGAWMEAHMHGAVALVSRDDLGADRRAALDRFFARALAKERVDRFGSMDELVREGDLAFGSESRVKLNSWAWVFPLFALPATALLGHGDTRSAWELFRLAGHGVIAVVLAGLAAIALAWRGRSTTAPAAAAAALGTVGAATGWSVVLAAVERAAPEGRFAILHQGLYEAEVNRAVGFWVAWGALCAALAREPRGTLSVWARVALMVACVSSLLMLAVGASSAGQCALMTAAVLALLGSRLDASRDDVLRRGVVALGATLAATATALVRHGAAEALVWNSSLDRATRVDRLTALAREGSVLRFSAALSAALVVLVVLASWRATRWREDARRGLRSIATVLLALVLVLALDGWQRQRVSAARSSARAAIAPQFAIFSRLDVVVIPGLAEPHVAPSVQLASDVVAIDGVSVVRSAALGSASVRATLAQDLSHRLARERTAEHDRGPRWTLAVDRRATWARVRAVLSVADEVGAGPCELLFGRSANPRWSVWAPPESALAVPGDYGAIEVRIGAIGDGALLFDEGAAFETVARALRARWNATGAAVLVR
jgi:hypothetical protein